MMVEIPGFAVGDEIGRGGFGVVYRARDLNFDRDVAIKVLRDAPGTDVQARFLTECRAVGSLGGRPGIPTVYSTGYTAEGAPYMAMELLPGGSLSDRMPLPAEQVVTIGLRLASALQAAHDGGVIHRDVKPANVLFDAEDQPVLVDFGISSLVGEATHSATGNVAVSVAFAPPEVLGGARAGVPADVYALGATLFCALTGRAPFVSTYGFESIAVIAARIATAPVENLRPLGVPDQLARVVEIAMAKDPDARYPSTSALAAALTSADLSSAALNPAAISSASSGPVAGPGAGGRRRPTRRSAVVAGVVSAAVLIGGVTALAVTSSSSAGPGAPVAASGQPSAPGPRSRAAGPAAGGSASSGTTASITSTDETRRTLVLPGGRTTSVDLPAGPVGAPTTPAAGTVGRVAPSRTVTSTVTVPHGPAASSAPPRTTAAPSTPPRTTTAPPPPNHAPKLSARNKTADEKAKVSLPITVSDPDSDAVQLSVSGLPSWLTLRGKTVQGTAPYNAASVTTTRTSIRTKAFRLTVKATDSHGASATTAVTLTIRDTYRTMPDFIGKSGSGNPSTSQISVVNRSCAYQKSGDNTRIFWQGVKPGSVIAWGRSITYRYGRNDKSCAHVTGHWPT